MRAPVTTRPARCLNERPLWLPIASGVAVLVAYCWLVETFL